MVFNGTIDLNVLTFLLDRGLRFDLDRFLKSYGNDRLEWHSANFNKILDYHDFRTVTLKTLNDNKEKIEKKFCRDSIKMINCAKGKRALSKLSQFEIFSIIKY